MPVFEDAWYYMWRERKLPVNVDPLDARLDDPMERDRLARVFRQGLDAVVGYVLPLSHEGQWVSTPWFLREERCFLLPGDSPIGFRLPLDSLPWALPEDAGRRVAVDPCAPRVPLQRVLLRRRGITAYRRLAQAGDEPRGRHELYDALERGRKQHVEFFDVRVETEALELAENPLGIVSIIGRADVMRPSREVPHVGPERVR